MSLKDKLNLVTEKFQKLRKKKKRRRKIKQFKKNKFNRIETLDLLDEQNAVIEIKLIEVVIKCKKSHARIKER